MRDEDQRNRFAAAGVRAISIWQQGGAGMPGRLRFAAVTATLLGCGVEISTQNEIRSLNYCAPGLTIAIRSEAFGGVN